MYTRQRKISYPGPDDTLRKTLPNGITVLARENFASPSVVIEGYLEVGATDEPRELVGLANFTGDVLERGTQHRSFEQLYEEVEAVGAAFGIGCGSHSTHFGAKGLVEHLPLLLDILNDSLRAPAFRAEQVEKARAEILTDFQEREQDPARMAHLHFNELVYPADHPYHYSGSGYPETVARITRDHLAEFHQRYFSPQGMVIVVVGAVKSEAAFQQVAEIFGDWQATRPPRAALPAIPALTERREHRLTMPEKMQSNLVLGWPGPERSSPDFLACYLANTIFGVFGMYGRLGKKVREDNGLAYYAYSRVDGGKVAGPWSIQAGVNPANVERAVDLILAEVRRLREERIPKEELTDSQSYLVGSMPLQLETNEGVAHSLVNIERHALGLDYLHRYRDLITKLTFLDLQKAAQRWMDPEHYALSIAGPQ